MADADAAEAAAPGKAFDLETLKRMKERSTQRLAESGGRSESTSALHERVHKALSEREKKLALAAAKAEEQEAACRHFAECAGVDVEAVDAEVAEIPDRRATRWKRKEKKDKDKESAAEPQVRQLLILALILVFIRYFGSLQLIPLITNYYYCRARTRAAR